MKIAGCIFRKDKIITSTKDEFHATYKNHEIFVSTDHFLGEPDDEELKRFNIEVTYDEGGHTCDTYQDFETIEEAIKYALHGSMLLPEQQTLR